MKKIQLSIPEPCHENWDAMSPTQQGRFCNACAKEVIDFSNMTDSEVLNYFLVNKQTEKLCGRVYDDQLHRDITMLPKRKRYWQWQYILSAALFFMKPAKTKAQGKVIYLPQKDTTVQVEVKRRGAAVIQVKGVVKDAAGNAIPFAGINRSGTPFGTLADKNGGFEITVNSTNDSLEISSAGYETKKVTVAKDVKMEIVLSKDVKQLTEVFVTSYEQGRLRCRAGGMSVRIIKRSLKDTVKSWLRDFNPSVKVYPNPVVKGGSYTLLIKNQKAGMYTLQVVNAGGQLLTEKKINVTAKESKEELTAGSSWSSGIYYVKVINETGKLAGTATMMIR